MTLHDAITDALRNLGNTALPKEIANYINNNNTYQRGDLKPLQGVQIIARINNYQELFHVDELGKISTNAKPKELFYSATKTLRNYFTHTAFEFNDVDLLLGSFLIFARNKNYASSSSSDTYSLREKISHFFMEKEFWGEELKILETQYSSLPIHAFDELTRIVGSFNVSSFSQDEFSRFFLDVIFTLGRSKVISGEFSTPGRVNNILAKLIPENHDFSDFYDPFAGSCSIIPYIVDKVSANAKFTFQDKNLKTQVLGKLNLLANNIENYDYNANDSLEHFPNTKFELIITNPPFGGRVNKSYDFNLLLPQFRGEGWPVANAEFLYVQLVLSRLALDGLAILLVPENFLFSSDSKTARLRKHLIEYNLIEKVISLPIGAFNPYSNLKASILVLKNKGYSRDTVEFFEIDYQLFLQIPDLPSDIDSNNWSYTSVDVSEIGRNEYFLNANRYINKVTLPEGKELFSIKSISKKLVLGQVLAKNLLNNTEGIPYVSIRHLSKSKRNPYLNIAAIDQFVEDSTMVRSNNKKKFIVPNSLLVAKVGSHLYPTIYKEKSLALASSSVYNIQVDEHKVLIEFLAIQLNEVYVQDQLNMTRAGTSQPFTKIDDFLNIQIWVPTIEEQQKIVNKTLYDIIKADKSLEKPDEDIEKKVVEVLKHEFGNLNNPLKEYLKNIKRYIEERAEIKTEKISSRPDAQSLEEVFDILENISNEMSTIIDDIFETFSTTQQQKESITVRGFFNAVKINLKSIDINLFINVDRSISSHHLIEADKMQLVKAFRNLAINAAKHGYPEGEKDKNMLIKASVSEDGQILQIDVINDGSPFPDEFTFNDYVALGKKTGDKKGSGIGGFLINRIISAHSGEFSQVDLTKGSIVEEVDNKTLLKGLQFLITLPLIND